VPITKHSIGYASRQEITHESYLNRLSDLSHRSASFPELSEILKFLTTQTLNPLGAMGAVVLIVSSDHELTVQGSFGLEKGQVSNLEAIPLDSNHPIALALQTTSHVYISNSVAMNQSFKKGNSFILIPLLCENEIYGLLVVILKEALDLDELERTFLKVISNIIAGTSLHHTFINTPSSKKVGEIFNKRISGQQDKDFETLENLALTQRQKTIAKMIAGGSTNREIARDLKFSEATIRYETIKLYERLRVRNRSQASARIRELKIL
jgi:DNA-binding CsgD family transcriptional regulator/transcriptional regulator with GAF, ATPase, and Fis domain